MRSRILLHISLLLLVIAIIWGRVFYLQATHFSKGETYFSQQEYKLALREYDSAMHMYTPFSSLLEKAASRLWEIGELYEAQGDHYAALNSFYSIRSSLYSSRSFFTPRKDWISKSDVKIASLSVKILEEEGQLSPENTAAEKKRILNVLISDRDPNIFLVMIAAMAFLGLIGAVISLTSMGQSLMEDSKIRQVALRLLALAVLFGLWALALYLA